MIIIPKNAKEANISINQLLAKICIRLIAKGIEKKMKYTGEIRIKNLIIGKIDNEVPDLTTSSVNLFVYYDGRFVSVFSIYFVTLLLSHMHLRVFFRLGFR